MWGRSHLSGWRCTGSVGSGVALHLIAIIDIDDLLGVACYKSVCQQPNECTCKQQEQDEADDICALSITAGDHNFMAACEQGLSKLGVDLLAQLVHLRINNI